jgi:hypothetical protein
MVGKRRKIFNSACNASTPEIVPWLPNIVKATRTGGRAINPLIFAGQFKLTKTRYGQGHCEHDHNAKFKKLLSLPQGWLIYNTHGLDNAGWDLIRSVCLEDLLDQLTKIDTVQIMHFI